VEAYKVVFFIGIFMNQSITGVYIQIIQNVIEKKDRDINKIKKYDMQREGDTEIN
jgi:hypothetical protein